MTFIESQRLPNRLPTPVESELDLSNTACMRLTALGELVRTMICVMQAHCLIVNKRHPVGHRILQLPPLKQTMLIMITSRKYGQISGFSETLVIRELTYRDV